MTKQEADRTQGPHSWVAHAIEVFHAFDAIDERRIATPLELEEFLLRAHKVAELGTIVPARLDGYDDPDVVTYVSECDAEDWKKVSGPPTASFRGTWSLMANDGRPDYSAAVKRVMRAARRVGLIVADDLRDPPLSPADFRTLVEDLLRQCEATRLAQPDSSGLVERPADPGAYRPAAKIIAGHSQVAPTVKALNSILSKHPEIRRHKPNPQRLTVHIGDWQSFVDRECNPSGEEDESLDDPDVIARRAADVRRRRESH